ncbi:maleylpyruvate isomerase family mycothiol-dependent enzyme [Mycobacterium sp. 21AC1]|uniref:maleylpyruvate isomerase family mycothiol-dependent enzyme n=1 Tax=[Mycobacterium] appelbergii TaxID=2939269 RepID=UPI00293932D9|nr:maleylpyruvate isomerase family mycothiol-dependent enzyme [Mycobacterium sp. 21AC1]MDV3126073.1 maleylpyruvate isomerase family mycothiol-dependent enzyme [Mycobacterium sp. 21AC1]
MDDDTLLGQLQADLIAIQAVALAEDADLTRPLSTCPGWSIGDLLAHLWTIQTWVRDLLRTREYADEQEPHPDPVRAVADFIDGIPDYLTAMRAITADEPCWNFGPPPRLAGFWIRRQAHEHAVHRVDVEAALGSPSMDFTPAFAADGVDEILSMFYPRQVRRNRVEPVTEAVQFRAGDTGQTWTLGEGDPVAIVTAPANDLYLGLWKRRELLQVCQVDGDHAAVRSALTRAFAP